MLSEENSQHSKGKMAHRVFKECLVSRLWKQQKNWISIVYNEEMRTKMFVTIECGNLTLT